MKEWTLIRHLNFLSAHVNNTKVCIQLETCWMRENQIRLFRSYLHVVWWNMVMGVKNGLENINCEIFENFQDIFILCLTASSPSRWCTWLFYDTIEHLLVLFFAVKKLYVIVSSIKKKKKRFSRFSPFNLEASGSSFFFRRFLLEQWFWWPKYNRYSGTADICISKCPTSDRKSRFPFESHFLCFETLMMYFINCELIWRGLPSHVFFSVLSHVHRYSFICDQLPCHSAKERISERIAQGKKSFMLLPNYAKLNFGVMVPNITDRRD